MTQNLSAITFFVDDYDSAVEYFTTVLNFTLTEDKVTGENSRFVLVTPPHRRKHQEDSPNLAKTRKQTKNARPTNHQLPFSDRGFYERAFGPR